MSLFSCSDCINFLLSPHKINVSRFMQVDDEFVQVDDEFVEVDDEFGNIYCVLMNLVWG